MNTSGSFISPQEKVGLDGVTATRLYYSSQDVADLKGIPALAGYPNGTFNTIEVCVHHAAGLQHHMQFAMIIFVPENV